MGATRARPGQPLLRVSQLAEQFFCGLAGLLRALQMARVRRCSPEDAGPAPGIAWAAQDDRHLAASLRIDCPLLHIPSVCRYAGFECDYSRYPDQQKAAEFIRHYLAAGGDAAVRTGSLGGSAACDATRRAGCWPAGKHPALCRTPGLGGIRAALHRLHCCRCCHRMRRGSSGVWPRPTCMRWQRTSTGAPGPSCRCVLSLLCLLCLLCQLCLL